MLNEDTAVREVSRGSQRPVPPHSQTPDLLGHLLQGDAMAESQVAEVQKGHAQTLVLKMVDLLLARQLPQ